LGRRLAFDLETDGLLDSVTRIHCAVAEDIDTGEVWSFADLAPEWRQPDTKPLYGHIRPLSEFLDLYRDPGNHLVGHNVIKYDCAVIQKLHGLGIDKFRITDTMVLGRLVHPDIKVTDFQRAARWREYKTATDEGRPFQGPIPKEFPAKCIGLHSLAAWGYRLGLHKGDYDGGWESWSPAMHSYMLQDGAVSAELYRRLMANDPSAASVELEHRIAWLCAQIERNGFPFNVKAATELYGRLVDEREGLRRELVGLFPNWKERLPDFIPARNNKTKGYITGVPEERWKEHEFNPTSRDHIANRLQAKYGWKPTEFTDGGKATVDDEVLAKLPYPEAKPLARYFLLDKRIGQLAEGNQAWLKVQHEGKIHASYNTNGAVTGRATHSRPNISQVPRVSSEFGRDCRALFHVPSGWVLLGADQSGLELRCLASDMSAFDGGDYAVVVTQGDVHTINQHAAGLPTRDNAKTFIYAFLYGAGDDKIGSIAGKGAAVGKKLKQAFLAKTPALKKLIELVRAAAKERGWIKGLDGRKMPIRSDHAALNTRLQNSGAVICKRWGCDWEDELLAKGLKHGWDGDFAFLSWSHDEYQVAVRDDPKIIETVRNAAVKTGRAAGLPYNFKCPLDVETKTGANWAETH
jgi:DNA polymerase I-like protein with 3'-5' exonuclease and polymerase domains